MGMFDSFRISASGMTAQRLVPVLGLEARDANLVGGAIGGGIDPGIGHVFHVGRAVIVAGQDFLPLVAADLDRAAGSRLDAQRALDGLAVPRPAIAAILAAQHLRRTVAEFERQPRREQVTRFEDMVIR